MHLIWLSVVVPSLLFVVWAFPDSRHPKVWLACFGLALAGLLVVIGLDIASSSGNTAQHGWPKGQVYTVLQTTSFPLVAAIIGCIISWGVAKRWPAERKLVGAPASAQGVEVAVGAE